MRYLSSQSYRNAAIVESKRESEDYEVQICIVPLDGEEVAIVLDGHHSFEAALADGVEPQFEDVSTSPRYGTDTWMGEEMETVAEYMERIARGGWYTLCER